MTNRDLSVAVLRAFLPMRAEEIASGVLRRNKTKAPRAKKPADAPAAAAAAGANGAPSDAAAAAAGAAPPPPPQAAAAAPAAPAPAAPAPAACSGGGARILEGLAASGLRSIRYALELDGVDRVDANDLDPAVVETMRANIAFNGPRAEAKVQTFNDDARLIMLKSHQVGLGVGARCSECFFVLGGGSM